jgi:hypothetical protein
MTPSNTFRFGPDGIVAPLASPTATLPQPYFPGTNGFPNAGDPDTLDPNFRPNRVDTFTLSVQRQISRKVNVDVGYIGRIAKNDFQELNLDAIPTMLTEGGQTFASAYASLYSQVCSLSTPQCAYQASTFTGTLAAQPFFETALGGASSAYCKGYANCTTAVLASASANLTFLKANNVASLYQALNNASTWVPGKTTIDELGQANSVGLGGSFGYSNYNASYISVRMADYHGLTFQSNLTWSRSLGTAQSYQATSGNTALDPWNLQANYGPQVYDYPITYNFIAYYQPPFFKNQAGWKGALLGGWTIAPLFTAQSGSPIDVGANGNQFGETASPSSSVTSTADGNAVAISPYTGGNSRILGVPLTSACTTCAVATTVGGTNPLGQGQWANPGQIYGEFRPCVLGVETNCGGYTGQIRGVPSWNVDATIAKNFSILKEDKLGATLIFQITNVLNHMQPGTPSDSVTGPTTFGRITSQANTPRNMEFGLRINF